jgi:protein O-GlcNAc transferase
MVNVKQLRNKAIKLFNQGQYYESEKHFLLILNREVANSDLRSEILQYYILNLIFLDRCDEIASFKENFYSICHKEQKQQIYHQFLENISRALFLKGYYKQARNIYFDLLKENHVSAQIHCNLGVIQSLLNQQKEAESHLLKAIKITSSNPEFYYHLANVYKKQNKAEASIEYYHKAISLKPDYSHAWYQCGLSYNTIALFKSAENAFIAAIKHNHQLIPAYIELAINKKRNYQYFDAIEVLLSALSLQPESIIVMNNLANLYQEISLHESAMTYYKKILQKNKNILAYDNLLSCLNYQSTQNAEFIFQKYCFYTDYIYGELQPVETELQKSMIRQDKKISLAYISADFNQHVMKYFIEPLLNNHNSDCFNVYLFSNSEFSDSTTELLSSKVYQFINIHTLDDDEVCELIIRNTITVLIDLSGHTKGNRLGVFKKKPAKIQMSWLGYGYTSGLREMDYFIADRWLVPKHAHHLFSEKVIYLPETFLCYKGDDDIFLHSDLPYIKKGYFTFGSLTRTIRLNDQLIKTWSLILKNVPGSKLLLDNKTLADPKVCDHYAEKFCKNGISRDRLILAYSQPHWPVYKEIDVALDPFPHNAGTTTLESLWMGVPVLTLMSRPSVGRIGSSILNNLQLQWWIASDEDQYIKKASDVLSLKKKCRQLRKTLRGRLKNSVICDETTFAKNFELLVKTLL